jgi:polyisoprenoid-binding protein YceI
MTATASPSSSAPSTATRDVGGVEIPHPGTYTIDPSHTNVGFVARHMMVSKTRGRLPSVSGSVTIGDHPLESSVAVSIDTGDLDTGDGRRDAHLRSADFFEVERFPTITYRSHAVREARPGRWEVDGDLTVRDVTRPVTLEVTFEGGLVDPMGNARIGFSAAAEIDRYDFGLTWNQALEGGGLIVGRKVTLEIEVEAVADA